MLPTCLSFVISFKEIRRFTIVASILSQISDGNEPKGLEDPTLLEDWDEIYDHVIETWKGKQPKPRVKPHIKSTQLHFFFDRETRLKVAEAWKAIREDKKAVKRLSARIAKEVIRAAANLPKSSK